MNFISVTGKNWILNKFNHSDISFLKDNFFLDEIIAKLLLIRKIRRDEIKDFLNPSIKNVLPNPENILDMEKSTLRTIKSINQNDVVGIFGDYDVDGASSTALMGRYLKDLKIKYQIYIPDREKEGFGPSIKGFKSLIDQGAKLIFTVDCGTLSFEAISYAKNNNIDVIVLDHHQAETKLPEAYSIINPNRLDDKSNLQYLCAAGVTFMFLISMNKGLRNSNWFKKNFIKEPNLIDYLDLVSLGTVCDVVPLKGLNRAIVKQGLKVLKAKKNLGLKTLFDICKIETNPSTYHLGYMLGPRINAGGRVGKCSHGANLLLNSDPKKAFQLANELDNFNKERKLIEENLLDRIMSQAKKNLNDPLLVLEGKNWHEGVIGIVASRLKDKFNKPVIIISIKDQVGKASARSILGFDIGSTIIAALNIGIILKGGGHKMAGGFSIDVKNIDKFKDFIFKRFNKLNLIEKEMKPLILDSKIAPTAVNLDFFDKIDTLSPFGAGNPEPKFIIENLKPLNSKIVGEKHIKSTLIGMEGTIIKTIAFNAVNNEIGPYLLKMNKKIFNIAGKLSLNEWRGEKNVEFIIDDISVNKKLKSEVPSSIG